MANVRELMFGRRSGLNRELLDRDLRTISDSVSNKEQFKLYTIRVRQLRDQRNGLRRIGSGQILDHAQQLKRRIAQVSSSDEKTRHEELVEIIRDEFKSLNTLKQQSQMEISNDKTDEETAIGKDRLGIERIIRHRHSADKPPIARSITLYSMDEATLEPITLTGNFTRYSEVLRRLKKTRPQLRVVDIWIRKEGKHNWTSGGHHWIRVAPLHDIQDQIHDYCDAKNRSLYVVALVNENGVDSPIALGMKRDGEYEECCMPNHCGNLRTHLERIWPNREVEYAHKLDAPNEHSDDILRSTFDDNYLLMFTHQLCLICTPRP